MPNKLTDLLLVWIDAGISYRSALSELSLDLEN